LHDRADNCVYFGRAGFVEILQHRRSEISERRAHFGTLGGRHPGVEPDPTPRCRRLFEQIGTQLAQARFGHKRPHMDDRPNHPVGGNRAGKRTFRIERRQGDIRPVFGKSIKKPPGNAIHRRNDDCLRSQQRADTVRNRRHGRCLHRNDDVILRPEIGRVVTALGMNGERPASSLDRAALRLRCRQMRTAGDQADIVTGIGQNAADRPGNVDAYSH